MNNKYIGTVFERKMCAHLAQAGWWVHFLYPDARGAQPFDIIAVKNGEAMAIDCKTCSDSVFRISRLEDNQVFAFEKWLKCGNDYACIAVLHDKKIYMLEYPELKIKKKIDLKKEDPIIDEGGRWRKDLYI